MNSNSIEIIINHSPLKREIYTFWLQDCHHIWLDSYRLELRKTVRHKFKLEEYYDRLDNRNSNLTENQVILFDEIKEQAKFRLISQIKVQKWSERIQ